jgi:hypothetical protein
MQAADVAVMPGANLWRAWLGFNLSHSLGLLVFAGLLLVLAFGDDSAFGDSPAAALAAAVAANRLVVAARFFYVMPVIVADLALACLAGAWVAA